MLTAHGSPDPRSAANARAVAGRLARLRPGLDVRVAFCEQNPPSLVEVLGECPADAVVAPPLPSTSCSAAAAAGSRRGFWRRGC
ncbi:cbiX family protein [Mycobacterium kansasii 662]|uniref:CbiX family protein n=1 Tax=Mycobacterium kansasii 662 TaxID=1299326 RepID=X7ZNR1_MYCKA|nr:cbiX family protein [Mycobacterium kansasii 662]